MDLKEQQLALWLRNRCDLSFNDLELMSGGASARRFYRFSSSGSSYIAMDMSSNLPACQRYLTLATGLASIGWHVPTTLAADPAQGFVWMSDLGDVRYDRVLNAQNVTPLYTAAMQALLVLQASNLTLPAFDRTAMMIGLEGFEEYFLYQYLGAKLSLAEKASLHTIFDLLINSALSQPQRPMHRDYHSQNLLHLPNQQVGIVDFQDAKIGPVTYDLVSLLRDCYIDWPAEQVSQWVLWFYHSAVQKGQLTGIDEKTFLRYFDWMGLKRHLKALFTFSRKHLRDHDSHYLQYVPRTLAYIRQVGEAYEAFSPLISLLERCDAFERSAIQ